MTTYRGLDGFLALGGALTGTPLVAATLATGATELNVTGGGSTLTGVLALGDIFTLGGETNTPKYRVKTSCYAATGTAILATIPFEPGVSEEIAEDASLTVQTNSMAEAKLWNLTAEPELLDSTVLGDKWRTYHSDSTLLGTWSGRGEAYLDYTDTEQASLINAIASPANLLSNPLNFSNWSSSGTPVVTTNQADPFGGNAAYLVEDNSSSTAEYIYATVTFATDGEKSMSVFMKEGTAAAVELRLQNTTDSTNILTGRVTWVDNEPVVRIPSGGGTRYPVEEVASGWYLVSFSATSVVASNTHQMQIRPHIGAAEGEGTMSIYGAKACDSPTPGSLYPPGAPTVAMLFGVATDKQFYGYAKLSNLQITAQKGELVTVSYDLVGTGAIRPNWT